MHRTQNRALARLSWQFATLLGLSLTACGGSSEEPGSGEVAQAGGAATSKMLSDRTAGKPCTTNKDCGTGACKRQLPVNSALGVTGMLDAPGGYCSFECGQSADCGEGGVCIGINAASFLGAAGSGKGQCLARCDTISQCRDGYRCADVNGAAVNNPNAGAAPSSTSSGSCQVAPATDKVSGASVGNACSADTDCSGGKCSTADMTMGGALPGGYCSGRCLMDADCGERALCDLGAAAAFGLGGTAGTCYRSCTQDADCGRDGYRCRSGLGGTAKRCLPGSKPLADATAGKPCAADADCGGAAMSCITQMQVFNPAAIRGGMVNMAQLTISLPYPGGYCSQRCVDNGDCGAGGTCVGGFGTLGGSAAIGTCYQSCNADGDCRSGYSCGNPGTAGIPGGGMGMGMPAAAQVKACFVPPPAADQDAGVD